MKKKKILALSPRPAHPPNTGAKLREFHLLRQLSRWAEVTLLALHPDGGPLELDFCTVECFARPRGYTPGKVLRGLFGGQALSILNYRSEPMAQRLAALLQGGEFDAVLLEALHMAAYRPELDRYAASLPRVWDWHNIESELMERYASSAPTPAHALYARMTAGRLRRLELEILRRQDIHLVCSGRERQQLLGWVPGASVAVIPNGVDCRAFAVPQPPPGAPFLFVGSLDYHANVEGLRFFTSRVWPELRLKLPQAQLSIVGSRPGTEVLAMGQIPGIEVVGPVPRVEPYYEQAQAAIVPLFTGGGTRLKILEAFAARVPVVSTALGMEGIEATPGKHFLLAESPAQWVDALAAVAAQGGELATQGRELAERVYDWDVAGQALRAVLAPEN